MGYRIIIGIAVVISFILLNVFSRFIYDQSWFGTYKFSKEVNPYDIISLVVTSLITIWLGWYISKKINNLRYQKDYLIDDLKLIEIEINKIESNLNNTEVDLQILINILTIVNININRFKKTADIFKLKKIDMQTLENCYSNLYSKSTNTEGEFLTLSESNCNELKQLCSEFIIAVRTQIYKINNQ